ncbi:MAG: NUDIX hydrolase [Sphingomonadales bacterium]|nr:NUDIX hydrolase [Sphingomonadales bacterium]MDE2568371.1 NUDIX hydrolase [Sphingomonadales bacterium]
MNEHHDPDAPVEIMWEGRFIVAKRKGRWEYVSRARDIRAAVILAVDEADNVLLVEQYRVPLGRPCIELPAGLIGDDDSSHDEDVATAAARELEEETGYRAARLEVLGEYWSSPGMVTESFTLVRAFGLEKVSEGGGTEGENITVHHVPLAGLAHFLETQRQGGKAIDVRLLMLLGQEILGRA